MSDDDFRRGYIMGSGNSSGGSGGGDGYKNFILIVLYGIGGLFFAGLFFRLLGWC